MEDTIGWVGLGKMGLPMAQRLRASGQRMLVWARNPEQTLALRKQGAQVATDLMELAHRCSTVITILGDTRDVDSVYHGLQTGMQPCTLFIDMTTAAPGVATTIQAMVQPRGAFFLDAPVTGGVPGAAEGTLTHFVGGDAQVLDRAREVLAILGRRAVHCGPAGSGYRMKLVNQTIVVGILLGLAEGMALARASQFDSALINEALGAGTASGVLFNAYADRMMTGGGDVNFTLGLLRKDLRLAQAEADLQRQSSRFLNFAIMVLNQACDQFGPQAGVQMLGRM
ncbi:NAD(P)-dependent oxidoreductase [Parapusillimonas sp. SGNA-6]|nr:NAD(P)-dependent oxidoreductase [Parapusillimonas sp. SGNA-6]